MNNQVINLEWPEAVLVIHKPTTMRMWNNVLPSNFKDAVGMQA
jgi:hypothetical protein